MSNKNIKNSRNIEKIFIGDICNTNNTISFRDSLTNYKTQITTNSNRGAFYLVELVKFIQIMPIQI